MIEIALHRSLSWNAARSDVRQEEQGVTCHGWRDKSADFRRAHLVGWVGVLRCCGSLSTGASHENANEIKTRSAIAHPGALAKTS